MRLQVLPRGVDYQTYLIRRNIKRPINESTFERWASLCLFREISSSTPKHTHKFPQHNRKRKQRVQPKLEIAKHHGSELLPSESDLPWPRPVCPAPSAGYPSRSGRSRDP